MILLQIFDFNDFKYLYDSQNNLQQTNFLLFKIESFRNHSYNFQMKKILSLFLALFLISCINCIGIRCPKGKILSPQGCITDCSSPQFDRCQDQVFPLLYNPSYCAWNDNNEWVAYTYACQACQNPNIKGFKQGNCNGQEKTQFDEPRTLPQNFRRNFISHACLTRPSLEQCPVIYYIRAPQLNYCGMTNDGTLQGYDRACSACQDEDVVSYWQTSCENIKNRNKIFMNNILNQGQCEVSDDCRAQWQICSYGKCIDRCAVMRCAGGCRRGRCYPINNYQRAQPL